MKTLLLVISLFTITLVKAQNFDNPGEYMGHISKQNSSITKNYLNYISAVSHGKKARKVEKLRTKLLNEIDQARNNVMDLPAFNNDRSLRDSAMAHLLLVYRVFNEDYAKIVDMEEIAEQSYDLMEAYMLAKEKASEKLDNSGKKLQEIQKVFAKKNNVNLIDQKSETDDKMEKISKVNNYYNKLYLLHFKNTKQELYALNALEKRNVNELEQNRNALAKTADAGLMVLDTAKGFEGDKSLVTALKDLLKYYKIAADKDFMVISDFLLKSENFQKMKNDFEKKSNRTQEEVDAFNKAVKELNEGVNQFNNTNKAMNEKRNALQKDWETAVNQFMDTHMPYAN